MKGYQSYRLVILISFLVYAVSPLTYNLTAGLPSVGADPAAKTRSFTNVTLFVLEALFEAITQNDGQDEELPANRILIKKKWAVNRGRRELIPELPHAKKQIVADTAPCPFFPLPGKLFEPGLPTTGKAEVRLPRSSGLSPPRLS